MYLNIINDILMGKEEEGRSYINNKNMNMGLTCSHSKGYEAAFVAVVFPPFCSSLLSDK